MRLTFYIPDEKPELGDLFPRYSLHGREINYNWSEYLLADGGEFDKEKFPELYKICKKLPDSRIHFANCFAATYVVRAKP